MTIISGTIISDDGKKELTVDEPLIPVINKTDLKASIDTATAAKNGVVTSVNGNDVPTTDYWVTQSQMEAFTTAIATAQAFYDNVDVNQSMIDSAKIVLDTAITVFNVQKKRVVVVL